jgi:hypothetical protein
MTVGCPTEPSTAAIDAASNHGHAADTAASARVAPKAAFNATSNGEIPVGELFARPPAIALASAKTKTRRAALSGRRPSRVLVTAQREVCNCLGGWISVMLADPSVSFTGSMMAAECPGVGDALSGYDADEPKLAFGGPRPTHTRLRASEGVSW